MAKLGKSQNNLARSTSQPKMLFKSGLENLSWSSRRLNYMKMYGELKVKRPLSTNEYSTTFSRRQSTDRKRPQSASEYTTRSHRDSVSKQKISLWFNNLGTIQWKKGEQNSESY
ncbi:hypothetical protein PHET_02425 [Paragonimus heterotremus]|uniref:Uncharacterized protein n=1 Tax=Paragonimus heterotremus TaxID=100268 RepID=A0A8J4TCU3_9TREM|nr:hypothetical protein PHET_02425 [Paragonimus heterotremus]